MHGDDETIRLRRPVQGRPAQRRVWPARALVAALSLAAAGGGAFLYFGSAPPPITAPPPAVAQAPAPILPLLATEAEILADTTGKTAAFRLRAQPEIMVVAFASLAEQADTLNRSAAFIERAGFPHDRALDAAELDRQIRAKGGTPDTFYYGHDYRATDLLRVFAAIDRAGLPWTAGETRLRAMLAEWDWREGTNAALITLARADAPNGIDAAARATILRHELSHGLYFTSPAYAAFAKQFWATILTDAERRRMRAFLASDGYDTTIEDLVVNEAQAYLVHTTDPRFFSAEAAGMTPARLDQVRGLFVAAMPPGWLRDCTPTPASPAPATPIPALSPAKSPRRRQRFGLVRTTITDDDRRAPPRAAASRAARRSRR